jgi:putative restriction endonuclease
MIAINGTTALDAAHIRQFKKGGSNHPTNGIALSKTAHWLIDHGFWSISNDFRVIVAANRFEKAGEDACLLCHELTKERAIPPADLVLVKARKATGR